LSEELITLEAVKKSLVFENPKILSTLSKVKGSCDKCVSLSINRAPLPA